MFIKFLFIYLLRKTNIMDATQEINFYNNFDFLARTLKDHDPQVVKALNEIAIYVAGLHIEVREKTLSVRKLMDDVYKKDNHIEALAFMVDPNEQMLIY